MLIRYGIEEVLDREDIKYIQLAQKFVVHNFQEMVIINLHVNMKIRKSGLKHFILMRKQTKTNLGLLAVGHSELPIPKITQKYHLV